jgi:hypothetical protein
LSADELMDALDLRRLELFDLTNVQIVHYGDVATSLGTADLLFVHKETQCKTRDREIIGCCIHAPSDHPLNKAVLAWVPEAKQMIRVCDHGEGHTDPDDLAFRASIRMQGGTHTVSTTEIRDMAAEGYQFSHDCSCKCCVAVPA